MTARDRGPRLGRGLAALLGETSSPSELHTIQVVPLSQIRPGPFQPRMAVNQESLENLAASIRASGILQPILVRPEMDEADCYQIVAGERRWRAAQLAGLPEIPCIVRRLSDLESMEAGLIENLQRQDLNPIEEAEGYRRLTDEFGLLQEELARNVGKSRSHVANTMRLLALPKQVQLSVRSGALSAGHARALLSHPDPVRAAMQVTTRGLNVRQTEALARPSTRVARAHTDNDPNIVALEHELSAHLGLTIAIAHSDNGGTLRINYRDLDQLEGVIRLLRGS